MIWVFVIGFFLGVAAGFFAAVLYVERLVDEGLESVKETRANLDRIKGIHEANRELVRELKGDSTK